MIKYTGLLDKNTLIIKGSGVSLDNIPFVSEPDGQVRVVMASRLLKDKGVIEYLEAARQLNRQGVDASFILAGEHDLVNSTSITLPDLQPYLDEGVIDYIGHDDNVPKLFARAHIVVLPSYREGFPKVLIEAAACGRAVITTDVLGCRDAVELNVTGVIVPTR